MLFRSDARRLLIELSDGRVGVLNMSVPASTAEATKIAKSLTMSNGAKVVKAVYTDTGYYDYFTVHTKNGDVVLGHSDKSSSCNRVYIYKDKPALTLFGTKIWPGKKELIKFGIIHCFFASAECNSYYDDCISALKESIDDLKKYISQNKKFADIGSKMITTWEYSLKQTRHKELPVEIIRSWKRDKKT